MAGQLAMSEPGGPNARRARGRILQLTLTIHPSYLAAMAYELVVVPATIVWRGIIAER